jgi:hypothetical protein
VNLDNVEIAALRAAIRPEIQSLANYADGWSDDLRPAPAVLVTRAEARERLEMLRRLDRKLVAAL